MTAFDKIRQWGKDKGLTGKNGKATADGQVSKLQEEFDELKDAIEAGSKPFVIDAIGDMAVVLTLLADLEGLRIEDCIDSAYKEIATRTGRIVNGVFVKDK